MFDKDTYKKDCDRLTLGRDTLEEMICMSEQKKTRKFKPLRVIALTAALVAALGLTAAATDGPIREMIGAYFFSYTVVNEGDGNIFTVSLGDNDVMTGRILPAVDYEEKDGRCILTLDGEEMDVTEAMEKDGYYERELDDAILRITADGTATFIALDENGEPVMTYSIELIEVNIAEGLDVEHLVADGELGTSVVVNFEGDLAGATEVTGSYIYTGEGGVMIVTGGDGNAADIPQE